VTTLFEVDDGSPSIAAAADATAGGSACAATLTRTGSPKGIHEPRSVRLCRSRAKGTSCVQMCRFCGWSDMHDGRGILDVVMCVRREGSYEISKMMLSFSNYTKYPALLYKKEDVPLALFLLPYKSSMSLGSLKPTFLAHPPRLSD
jgi:hypothetical protein